MIPRKREGQPISHDMGNSRLSRSTEAAENKAKFPSSGNAGTAITPKHRSP